MPLAYIIRLKFEFLRIKWTQIASFAKIVRILFFKINSFVYLSGIFAMSAFCTLYLFKLPQSEKKGNVENVEGISFKFETDCKCG